VPWRAVVEVNGIDNDDYAKYLVSIAGILKRGLSVQSPEVRLKYRWLYENTPLKFENLGRLVPMITGQRAMRKCMRSSAPCLWISK
jgi:hypothetical protein